jgi:uncharacterized glyoxalase superfamily protein PhnB
MLIPATRYRDCAAALDFITRVLGLEEHAVYRSEDGEIQHAQIRLGAGLMMFGPGADDNPFDAYMADPQELGGRETTTIYAVEAGPEVLRARWDRVQAAGAKVLLPLADQPYGGAGFTIADPEGHIWSFGDYDPMAG